MLIDVNSQKLWYTDSKTGYPVLFLHDWKQSSECWNMPSVIKQKYRVLTLDFPGHGKSRIKKAHNLDDLVGLVIEFCTKLNVKNPIIVSHSIAGEITARLLSYHPDFAKAVVLIAPSVTRPYKLVRSRKLSMLSALPIPADAKARIIKKFYKRTKKDLLHPREKVDMLLRETFVNILVEKPFSDFKKIIVPTYLIWGKSDTVIPFGAGKKLAKMIKDSTLYAMEQSGHFPFMEHRKEFYQLLDQILKSSTNKP